MSPNYCTVVLGTQGIAPFLVLFPKQDLIYLLDRYELLFFSLESLVTQQTFQEFSPVKIFLLHFSVLMKNSNKFSQKTITLQVLLRVLFITTIRQLCLFANHMRETGHDAGCGLVSNILFRVTPLGFIRTPFSSSIGWITLINSFHPAGLLENLINCMSQACRFLMGFVPSKGHHNPSKYWGWSSILQISPVFRVLLFQRWNMCEPWCLCNFPFTLTHVWIQLHKEGLGFFSFLLKEFLFLKYLKPLQSW